METLLYYIWKHRFYGNSLLVTESGQKLEIIDPGLHNIHSGPDFFNAKIKIGNEVWVGNVEIHIRSSEWFLHQHEKDKSYNSVILHVVEILDKEVVHDKTGREIPQLVLQVPDYIRQNYLYLLNRDALFPPCANMISEIPEIYLLDWKNALLLERLEQKIQIINNLLDNSKGNWNDVFYIVLARNFGFGVNNDAFERLAKSLPIKHVLKHKESYIQTEALFFGQAGLLEDDVVNEYFLRLKKEYTFLQRKYRLRPLEKYLFKNLRIRPLNFPHVKIAQLATFTRLNETLFSKILEISDLVDLQKLFIVELPEFWATHYRFEKQSVPNKKMLGLSTVNLIIINTVIPIIAAYGKKKQQQHLIDRAFNLLEKLPPECNSITTLFKRAGLKIQNAGDSQAVIQLKQGYCDPKKCIFCRIGHKLLSKQQTYD